MVHGCKAKHVRKSFQLSEKSRCGSHQVQFDPPDGVQFAVENNTNVIVTGIDKEVVGNLAASIRATRPPEPYKGKGVRYADEMVRRKAGKAGKKYAMKTTRKTQTQRRHARIRRKVKGTTERPRLAVFRSNAHIYAQVIDDLNHHTLLSASTLDPDFQPAAENGTSTKAAAAQVGKLIAQKAIEQGVTRVVFDRGGNLYHGRVAALADAARESGLEF